MSTTNSNFPLNSLSAKPSPPTNNKVIYSVLLSVAFIGVFFLSYYIYNLLSTNFFKENYRNYLAEFLVKVSLEVQTDLQDDGNVNINRIIEPYLSKEVDLLIVYRTNQELIQVFTKKGVTKDNLRIADQTYFLNQKAVENIYLDEKSAFVIANSTNTGGGIILGSITYNTIGVADFPYQYVLVFAVDDYLTAREVLESTVNRNSFFGGIGMLTLLALGFMLKEITTRSRERKNIRNEIEALKRSAVLPTPPPTPTNNISPASPIPDTTNQQTSTEPKPEFKLEDYIDHDEDDAMFGNDLIATINETTATNTAITNNTKLSDEPTITDDEVDTNDEAINEVDEKNREFLKEFLKYFLTNHAPSNYSALEEDANEEGLKTNPTSHTIPIRDFKVIENERAQLEQNRLYSHRLKVLLQIWLLAKPISSTDTHQSQNENLAEKAYLERIKNSLAVIGAPLLSQINAFKKGYSPYPKNTNSMGLVSDYALPDLVSYFCPEHNPREVTGKPILTLVHPDGLDIENSYLSSLATVPWLAEEKKFFKLGEPYLEKKERAISINTLSIIAGKPHIIKLIYTLEKYDRLTYEQKNHMLYLVNLLYKFIADAPKREEELFSTKSSLEARVRNFFRLALQYDSVVEHLFIEENPLFKLHFSLWTFSQGTLKNTKARFTELMRTLAGHLNRLHQHGQSAQPMTSPNHTALNHAVLFLSDHENRMVSIGFDLLPSGFIDPADKNKSFKSLSANIKELIEQELINDVGMESIGVVWNENKLKVPASVEEAEQFNINDIR